MQRNSSLRATCQIELAMSNEEQSKEKEQLKSVCSAFVKKKSLENVVILKQECYFKKMFNPLVVQMLILHNDSPTPTH